MITLDPNENQKGLTAYYKFLSLLNTIKTPAPPNAPTKEKAVPIKMSVSEY